MMKVITTPDKTLREKSRRLRPSEIKSAKIRGLVQDIKDTIMSGEYGVGMSAIQVGEPLAISVVMIRPTPNRPELEEFEKVYFNAEIIEGEGEKVPMWEGCCSVLGDDRKPVYAQVLRFKAVQVEYLDEDGNRHRETVSDFLAHVLQHEIDHLDGKLFTDLVDVADVISYEEYHKIVVGK